MNEAGHLEKFRARMFAIDKRNISPEEVVESVLDDYRAAAGHLINAVLARKGLHEQNFDKLARFLKEHPNSIENSSEVRSLYDEMKTIRATRVYGVKRDGEALRRAGEILERLKVLCGYHDPPSSL